MSWHGLIFTNGGYFTIFPQHAGCRLMHVLAMALTLWMNMANAVPAQDTDMPARQAVFVRQCHQAIISQYADVGPWWKKHCQDKWLRAINAMPMLKLLLTALPFSDQRPYRVAELMLLMESVDWLPMGEQVEGLAIGRLADVTLVLTGKVRVTGMQFHWQQKAAISPYDLAGALRVRGLPVSTLGCAVFSMASAGQEKVMAIKASGRQSMVLTVYHRPPPTGIDWGVYTVDVVFGGPVPDLQALQKGCYPGGGGRAWAAGTDKWHSDCPDP